MYEDILKRRKVNYDYRPPEDKPFMFTVDWDGLKSFERVLLSEARHCPKCSDKNWVNTYKKIGEKFVYMCKTCGYFKVMFSHLSESKESKSINRGLSYRMHKVHNWWDSLSFQEQEQIYLENCDE